MKKKNFKLLNLNKKTVSVIKSGKIKGGTNGGVKTLANGTDGFSETSRQTRESCVTDTD